MKLIFKISSILLLLLTSVFADAQIYNSLNVSKKDGLSNSNVTSICVDHLGYVWLGTYDGLNRFDGFETTSFFHNINDTTTVINNIINNIYEDQTGQIWIMTSSGVCSYNRDSQTFRRIRIENRLLKAIIIYESNTDVWFLESNVFYLYNKLNNTFRKHPIIFDAEQTGFTNFSIQHACEFDENTLLVAISRRGLFLIDKETKRLKPYYESPIVYYVGLEKDGDNIWVASNFSGIQKINKKNNTTENFNVNNSELSSPIILSFKKHPLTNTLWVATDGNGIQEFDSDFSLLNHFVSGPFVNQPLSENAVQSLFFTSEGEIWAGTVGSGAILLYPSSFEHFPFVEGMSAGPSNKTILKIIEDEANSIWLATDGGGLNKFSKSTYSFQNFRTNEINKITGIVSFSEDILLVSVYLGQLYFFNKKTQVFSDAHTHPLLKNIKEKRHYRLFRDSKNNIWIFDDQLWKIDLEHNKVDSFSTFNNPDLYTQISPLFQSVFEDTVNQNLWFGANGGLYSYSYLENRINKVIALNNYRNSYGSKVYSIIVNHEGNVVFGTSNGLYTYNSESELISNYLDNNELNNTVFTTLWETGDVLRATTSEGVLKIKSGNEIIKFHAGYHNFRPNAFLASSDSKVYLGTNNGFIRFSPETIGTDTISKPVVITSFTLHGTEDQKLKLPY